jgi:3-hydroxyisobutyrate dehydrogenase-like beta-hydroxyacid dehydrogenase
MSTVSVSVVVALAAASAVGFAGGYVFHATVGTERSAARQAVFEAQSTQRVLQAFEPVIHNSQVHKELSAVQSLADAQRLTVKYKEATLRSVESFERGASQLELPRERALAVPFLQEAHRIRGVISAAP